MIGNGCEKTNFIIFVIRMPQISICNLDVEVISHENTEELLCVA